MQTKEKTEVKRLRILCIAGLLLLYLPCYLTFYPGNVSVDTLVSMQQAVGNSIWTNHHPVLFTLFLKAVYEFAGMVSMSMNQSTGLMTFLQLVFWVAALSEVFVWVWERTKGRAARIICGIFLGCNPVLMIYGVELGKDTFFCGWMIWYCIGIDRLICGKGKMPQKQWVSFAFVSLMVMFARSNGVLIALGTGLCLIAFCKEKRKPLTILLGIQLLLLLFVQRLLLPGLDIKNPSFAEAATVPIQQIACTLKEGGSFSGEGTDYLDSLMPVEKWRENYNPVLTDPIKFAPDFQDARLNDTKGEFLKVWLEGLLANPGSYIRAYLVHIQGYWDIRTISNVSSLRIEENSLGLTQADFMEGLTGYSLRPLYYYGMQAFRKLPLWRYHMSQAVLAALLLTAAISTAVKKRKSFPGLLPLVLCFGTLLLAAPLCTQFRYFLPVYVLYPMILAGIGETLYKPVKKIWSRKDREDAV